MTGCTITRATEHSDTFLLVAGVENLCSTPGEVSIAFISFACRRGLRWVAFLNELEENNNNFYNGTMKAIASRSVPIDKC